MKFNKKIHATALFLAVRNNNVEIVKLLNPNIEINKITVLNY